MSGSMWQRGSAERVLAASSIIVGGVYWCIGGTSWLGP
eukprot:COSAG02_NODE_75253_length_147_cov_690.104167_1_plen_37_part_01